MHQPEDAYFEEALALHRDRDRLAEAAAAVGREALGRALEDAREACRRYLTARVPVTLRGRIHARLVAAGVHPEV